VYSISTLLLTGIIALMVGVAASMLYSRRLTPDSLHQREMKQHLERLQQQQKAYQHEVDEHFTDTSKLLANLAESYRDVHNHLAGGAENLCKDSISAAIISRVPDTAAGYGANDEAYENINQPLDYAPKSSPFETGMLNEQFGIEKSVKESSAYIVELPIDIDEPIEK